MGALAVVEASVRWVALPTVVSGVSFNHSLTAALDWVDDYNLQQEGCQCQWTNTMFVKLFPVIPGKFLKI